MKHSIAALVALTLAAQAQASDWGYHGSHSPEHWGEVSAVCAQGKNQSPIDISGTIKAELKDLTFNYSGKAIAVTNNGHTLQASIAGNNTLTVDGDKFELQQFHFHTPSENHVDGQSYPLEAHYVHSDAAGNLAVVSVFFKLGDENKELASLLAVAPASESKANLNTAFDAAALLPKEKEYYRFNGSLTTPPCSEGVRWLVMKEPKTMSQAQVDAFKKLMGNNNRPVQLLNSRVILSQ